jgi:hypothetical protein
LVKIVAPCRGSKAEERSGRGYRFLIVISETQVINTWMQSLVLLAVKMAHEEWRHWLEVAEHPVLDVLLHGLGLRSGRGI